MRQVAIFLALLAGQTIMQHRQVVHLQANSTLIRADFGGKQLELENAPPTIYLLALPPKGDAQGHPWSVEILNLGPQVITVVDRSRFNIRIKPNQTVQIISDGTAYATRP